MDATSFTNRDKLWQDLESGSACEWDIIVVGGGISGAGILREAVRRGYRTLLVEQRDFAWSPEPLVLRPQGRLVELVQRSRERALEGAVGAADAG